MQSSQSVATTEEDKDRLLLSEPGDDGISSLHPSTPVGMGMSSPDRTDYKEGMESLPAFPVVPSIPLPVEQATVLGYLSVLYRAHAQQCAKVFQTMQYDQVCVVATFVFVCECGGN